ncbi:hypothetical protein BGX34_008030 [Mortierella sp. NVP85]|nr:hypothetical protein BGX34_008030 [Mortierella sp. NVP85]
MQSNQGQIDITGPCAGYRRFIERPELLLNIFDYLTPQEILNCGRVDRRWRQWVNAMRITMIQYRNQCKEDYEKMQRLDCMYYITLTLTKKQKGAVLPEAFPDPDSPPISGYYLHEETAYNNMAYFANKYMSSSYRNQEIPTFTSRQDRLRVVWNETLGEELIWRIKSAPLNTVKALGYKEEDWSEENEVPDVDDMDVDA